MVDTLVQLIINIEEGCGNHFVYDVMPLKKKRPDLFPMVLAAFANHPRWFIDHLTEIESIVDRFERPLLCLIADIRELAGTR